MYDGEGVLIVTGGLYKFEGRFKQGYKNGYGKLYKKVGPNKYEIV